MRPLILSALLAIFPMARAHGRVTNITNSYGLSYTGWDPELALGGRNPPPLTAWSASNLGNIFVMPSQFNTSDITCHYNATPGALHVNLTAGDSLTLKWNEWPVSHKGPVLDYLAACNGSCAGADKEKLQWVKIHELGWLNSTGWEENGLGGTWASDILIANGFTWTVRVPEGLIEGNYVLRHEIIALHVAEELDGAQSYPQCVNLNVTRGPKEGWKRLEGGVFGSKLYGEKDKGIYVDIHKKILEYEIPGPKVWE